ncbi:MAG: Gfo/Idh/MocA family oxidoreductase [Cytophagaceae bacterium]|nr:Gfo/Idh/MocA family oxidoreductase [Cytophagaceae bacterium]
MKHHATERKKPSDVLLPVPATSSLQQYVRPGRKLGVVLVGLGKYSYDQLAPTLQQSQFCELVGAVTSDPNHAHEWQQRYDLPWQNCYDYQTFGSCRNNPNIDLAYVVTPNATYAEFVPQATEAGKHVLCEKPLGISVRDCEAMIEACRNAEVQLAVGYGCTSTRYTGKWRGWAGNGCLATKPRRATPTKGQWNYPAFLPRNFSSTTWRSVFFRA